MIRVPELTSIQHFDVCIVGGGMVGSALAIGLAKLDMSVALVEKYMPEPFNPEQLPDMRVSAISTGSQDLLTELGAWQHLESMRLRPFNGMEVYETEQGVTKFNSEDIDRTHLGHIIENRLVQLALHKQIDSFDKICWFKHSNIIDIEIDNDSIVTLDNGYKLRFKMLVGADGGRSKVRELMQIGTQGWQYQQQALGIQIQLENEAPSVTWQKFRAQGPLAFLPLYDNFASLVWYDCPTKIDELSSLSRAKLANQIEAVFPDRVGKFTVLDSARFPLTRMHANQYYKHNVVLVGDAAHTINPLAGQGVNLGFKDVDSLLKIMAKKPQHETDFSSAFASYQQQRKQDNAIMMTAMDTIYNVFSSSHLPVWLLRNIGLYVADKTGPIKREVMKYAMGLK